MIRSKKLRELDRKRVALATFVGRYRARYPSARAELALLEGALARVREEVRVQEEHERERRPR